VAPYLESKSLIALATTATSRSKNFPDVPTMAEVGYPQIDIKSWYAMIAPKDTPPEIIAFVSQSVAEAIKEPQVNEKLNKLELTPVASSPAELRVLIDSEIARFGKVAQEIGLEKLD
jgi:tripartite-type tricarboxylate transporter receptor subunit TctC